MIFSHCARCPFGLADVVPSHTAHSGSNPAELQLCPDTDVSGLVLTTLSLAGEAPGYGWRGEATESVKYK